MIQPGDVLDAVVVRAEQFGVIIDFNGAEGLIQLPELSWERISGPEGITARGERIRCVVTHIGPDHSAENPHYCASVHALYPEQNPWRNPEVYSAGERFRGRIVLKRSYGWFVKHPRNIDALLHIDDVPEQSELNIGDVVDVVITKCNVESQQIRVNLVMENQVESDSHSTAKPLSSAKQVGQPKK